MSLTTHYPSIIKPLMLLILLGCYLNPAQGQSNYSAFELNRANNWQTLITEDMNGDGLKDLVFSHFDSSIGRELHIHHQNPEGTFATQPQRIEIKTEIIAIGFADLRSDPGMELLLFANAGVFSLSTMIDGYAGNLKPLLQWELAAAVPDFEQVTFITNIHDINGDGHIDLLLPGRDGYGFFTGGPNEQFQLQSRINTRSDGISGTTGRDRGLNADFSINATQGISLNVTVDSQSPFENFIEQWKTTDSDSLLRADNWMPNALLAFINDDEYEDLIYLNIGADGLGQINIHYQQNPAGFNHDPDWTGPFDSRGELQLADINGDGVIDLVRVSGDGNEWDARFYLNIDGQFDFEQPSQLMRFSGYDVRLDFITLEADSTPILSVNYYTIPVVDAIRNASLNRIQLLFNHSSDNSGQVFNRRPDARIEETFSAANVRGLSEQLSLGFDVDGDQQKDALYITENGTIAAKKIAPDLTIASDPFWEYISSKGVFEFEVLALNDDEMPDLILRHGNSTTVLVARP